MEPVSTRDWRARIRDSRMGTFLVLAVTAALVLGAVYLVDRSRGTGLSPVKLTAGSQGSAPVVGRPVRNFTATAVDGTRVSLAGYRGHPVWLTFGASWCAACRAEAPDVQGAYQQARSRGVVVLAVFISEDSAAVRDFAARAGLTYVKVADPDTRIASQYRVLGIPVHFFIDRTGVLRATRTGGMSRAQMDDALAEISR